MLPRQIKPLLLQRLAQYPAIVIVGPRQCGKTTLAKQISDHYYDLETEAGRLRIDLEWEETSQGKSPVVLDEAQTFPEIFPRLRSAIDADRLRNGRFILLGSVAPSLMNEVAESLAGRIAIVELFPLTLDETGDSKLNLLWRYGGFPQGGVLDESMYPNWQRNYLALITQRDLPNLGLPAKPVTTNRLLKMVAALQGQLWNSSKIGAALGLNYQTVSSYLEYLDGTFLTRELRPFEANLKKRLVKSPKVYIRDSGLLHALLDFHSAAELRDQPWVGFSWEGFVIEQILSRLNSLGESVTPYFLRTSNGDELDLVFTVRGILHAVEIKLTSDPQPAMLKTLESLGDQIGAERKVLLHYGSTELRSRRSEVMGLPSFLRRLEQIA